MRPRVPALSFLLVLSLAACGGRAVRSDASTDDAGTGADAGPASDLGTASDLGPHDAGLPADAGATPDVFRVEFTTSKGVFVVEATRAWSPNGVDRFYQLVQSGFYDGCRFFRVVPTFMVQFGINGTPATNAMWSSRTIPRDPVTQSNTVGMVSFAQAASLDSRTTQLFINYADNSFLDAMGFSPIGRVVSGMSVATSIDSEYMEMPSQSLISSMGNAYLMSSFPNLDYVISARVM